MKVASHNFQYFNGVWRKRCNIHSLIFKNFLFFSKKKCLVWLTYYLTELHNKEIKINPSSQTYLSDKV